MTRGIVSLTAHKNNLSRKRAKEYREEIIDCARWPARNLTAPLAGYAVIMWAEDGEATAFWNGTEALGPNLIEDHVSTILRRTIAAKDTKAFMGIEDD